MGTFEEDFEWQRKFNDHFLEIAGKAIRRDIAPVEEDRKRNTDFMLKAVVRSSKGPDLRISARVRRHKFARPHRGDFTVRLTRPSGVATEMRKLRDGWSDLTVYGFESEPGSDRMYPWFLGNVEMLRDYLRRGGYYSIHSNEDGSSDLAAFYHADMPLGFVIADDGLEVLNDSRIWERCRKCWWWRSTGGVVMPLDEEGRPGDGYWRRCIACGFTWRSGWVMSLTRPLNEYPAGV